MHSNARLSFLPLISLALRITRATSQDQVPLGELSEATAPKFATAFAFPIPFEELNGTCTTYYDRLTPQEISVCEHFQSISQGPPVRLDILASVCGYTAVCERDPDLKRRESCMPDPGPGILYDRFVLAEPLSYLAVEGEWQQVRRTLACLKENEDLTRNLEMFRIQFKADSSSPQSISETSSLFIDTISTFKNLKELTVRVPTTPGQLMPLFTRPDTSTFPQVEHLELGPYAHPIIQHLPNLKVLRAWPIVGGTWMLEHTGWKEHSDAKPFLLLMEAMKPTNVTEANLRLPRTASEDVFKGLAEGLSHVQSLTLVPSLNITKALPFLQRFEHLDKLSLAVPARDGSQPGTYRKFWDESRSPLRGAGNDKLVALVCNSLPKLPRLELTETLGMWTNHRKEECGKWRGTWRTYRQNYSTSTN